MNLRKIYYVPGLISAIFIPLLFWFYGSQKLKEPTPNVFLGRFKKIRDLTKKSLEWISSAARNWNYKKIMVQPNTARKNSNYYVSEIKKTTKNEIKKKLALNLLLVRQYCYDDFISLLNDIEIAQQNQFGVRFRKQVFICTMYSIEVQMQKNSRYMFTLCNDVISGTLRTNQFFEKITYQFSEFGKLPKPAYYIIFGYLSI